MTTATELVRLFEACAVQCPKFYNAFIFLAVTGCRMAEARGIRHEHMDVRNQIVWVTGKGIGGGA